MIKWIEKINWNIIYDKEFIDDFLSYSLEEQIDVIEEITKVISINNWITLKEFHYKDYDNIINIFDNELMFIYKNTNNEEYKNIILSYFYFAYKDIIYVLYKNKQNEDIESIDALFFISLEYSLYRYKADKIKWTIRQFLLNWYHYWRLKDFQINKLVNDKEQSESDFIKIDWNNSIHENLSIFDTIEADVNIEKDIHEKELFELVSNYIERYKKNNEKKMREVWKILEMKLLNNYSNVQISNIVWLSAERVRQIIEKHLWKLQKHLIKNWYWY